MEAGCGLKFKQHEASITYILFEDRIHKCVFTDLRILVSCVDVDVSTSGITKTEV